MLWGPDDKQLEACTGTSRDARRVPTPTVELQSAPWARTSSSAQLSTRGLRPVLPSPVSTHQGDDSHSDQAADGEHGQCQSQQGLCLHPLRDGLACPGGQAAFLWGEQGEQSPRVTPCWPGGRRGRQRPEQLGSSPPQGHQRSWRQGPPHSPTAHWQSTGRAPLPAGRQPAQKTHPGPSSYKEEIQVLGDQGAGPHHSPCPLLFCTQ